MSGWYMRVSDIEEMVGRTSKLSGGTEYMELLEQIEDYWTDRAEGYSQVNQEELAGDNRTNWRRELESHFPEDRTNETYKILDIGTGPGFFSIILAEAGYSVMAVDYTRKPCWKKQKRMREHLPRRSPIVRWMLSILILRMKPLTR